MPGTAKALAKEASDLSGTTVRDKETPVAFERRETLVEDLLRERKEKEEENNRLLGPEHAATGVAGRRPTVEGIAVPFSLGGGGALRLRLGGRLGRGRALGWRFGVSGAVRRTRCLTRERRR